jgi:hypothetical protein
MALQFYSNENFPITMVNLLRSEGHDVLTSYEAGQANQGIPDDVALPLLGILEFAIAWWGMRRMQL